MLKEASDLFNNKFIQACLRTWSWESRITNMHTERLLSLVRRAAPKNPTPTAEKVIACGLLAQINRTHRLAGGDDLRSTSRSQLAKAGVPTRFSQKSRPKNYKKRRTVLDFINNERKLRSAQGIKRKWPDWGRLLSYRPGHEIKLPLAAQVWHRSPLAAQARMGRRYFGMPQTGRCSVELGPHTTVLFLYKRIAPETVSEALSRQRLYNRGE